MQHPCARGGTGAAPSLFYHHQRGECHPVPIKLPSAISLCHQAIKTINYMHTHCSTLILQAVMSQCFCYHPTWILAVVHSDCNKAGKDKIRVHSRQGMILAALWHCRHGEASSKRCWPRLDADRTLTVHMKQSSSSSFLLPLCYTTKTLTRMLLDHRQGSFIKKPPCLRLPPELPVGCSPWRHVLWTQVSSNP